MTISTAVDPGARARTVGIQTIFQDLRGGSIAGLPQRLAVIGQGATASTYATTKRQVSSAAEVGSLYGFGSPVHLAARQLLPANGDGVGTIPVTIYPLVDDGAGVVSDGDITPGGAQTAVASYIVRVNNLDSESFTIAVGDSVAVIVAAMTAAVNAVLEMPIIAVDGATLLTFTSKWEGESANDIFVEVVGDVTAGTTFAVTQATGGLNNPDIQAALDQVGAIWETMFLNCMEIADTATLDLYTTFGEARWGALVRKPMVAFTGNAIAAVASAIVVSDARTTDRINAQLVAPGSNDLPLVIAARQLARIVVQANTDPARDYGSQQATGLVPGTDAEQWNYLEQDTAVKAGSSTINVKDGVVNVADTVTFHHPLGEDPPAYRYVVDIVKLQNILFNLDLVFDTPEWDGAPLIPDDQATSNRDAKKPKTAKAAVATMLDSLGLAAIISDPEAAKATILAGINETNPKRLDIAFTVQLSGNTNIISIDLNFGFFFGTSEVVT